MNLLAALRAVAFASLVAVVAPPAQAADATPGLHGMTDAFAAPGIALAWGVLRGADEATTMVTLRIVADPARFSSVTVSGTDPFSQRTVTILPATAVSGRLDLRIPRAHFSDFPRTDLRFERVTSVAQIDTQSLVVYFLGVPDTTPEFTSAVALDAHLSDRIARIGNAPAGKTP